jgi:anti-sigma factor RsiW
VSPCASPLSSELLVDYWAGDLPPRDEEGVEEHLFGCASCTAGSARVAAITETLRAMIPPVVTRAALDRFRARGLRVYESTFAPGERREAHFGRDLDLLIFRLGGIDLSRATRVRLLMREETTGATLVDLDDAPFDAEAGAVLLCCQRHFASLPPDVVVEIRVDEPRGEAVTSYTILHRFD